jgi:asparagine synthase (glutamine-hydrolysing)
MCGITGIVQFGRRIDSVELTRFNQTLSHRGPDGQGIQIVDDVGLGHTRLAILDLSESGKCPMFMRTPRGKELWITFNGEIFNFLELRTELRGLGYSFNSDTDTEVIMAAYDAWGADCLMRFNGMWAFAIWDATEKKLFASRDRFGVKPLYYRITDRLVFASEIKSFLALSDFSPELNSEIVPLLLQAQRYDGRTNATAYKGVYALLAGHTLTVTADGQVDIRRWWDTIHHIHAVPKRYEEQVEQFKELFLDAVRLRLRSDVSVGTCLSGGVDSSCVASSIAYLHRMSEGVLERSAGNWRKAFIARFPGAANDETRYAQHVAEQIRAEPHYWDFDSETALQSLIESQWSLDEPAAGYAVPVWCLYRELRRNHTLVSLDGHGGDELLGGYGWYLDWIYSEFNQRLFNDFHSDLLPTILRNYDRCSMAHGIEVRMPIMDYRVVTYAFSLPPESKVGGGFTKRIFRDAMRGIVPEQIRTRRQKIGFNVPITDWFNSGMAHLIEKIVSHPLWIQSPFFDGKVLGPQIIDRTRAKGWKLSDWDLAFRVSTYLNLVMWQMMFIEKRGPHL